MLMICLLSNNHFFGVSIISKPNYDITLVRDICMIIGPKKDRLSRVFFEWILVKELKIVKQLNQPLSIDIPIISH